MMPADRILHQQYRERNFQVYSESISTLLQAERHKEILVDHWALPHYLSTRQHSEHKQEEWWKQATLQEFQR
jgi:hypothetical protein